MTTSFVKRRELTELIIARHRKRYSSRRSQFELSLLSAAAAKKLLCGFLLQIAVNCLPRVDAVPRLIVDRALEILVALQTIFLKLIKLMSPVRVWAADLVGDASGRRRDFSWFLGRFLGRSENYGLFCNPFDVRSIFYN